MDGKNACRALSAVIALSAVTFNAAALDKNGNFESVHEQDAFIAVTLKKMAGEVNQQTPIQVDEATRLMSAIALQKTLTFNYQLTIHRVSEIDVTRLQQVARENQNQIACRNKATRTLIDLGVVYVYAYSDKDGKMVTRVPMSGYRC